jgi:hypothetical protein
MVNEINTAVIVSMDKNYEENLINDFLSSLYGAAEYKGKVFVLNYGMSDEAIEKIQKEYKNVTVVLCSRDSRLLFSVRYKDIVKVIEGVNDDITHFMAIDGGDVWFQTSINEAFNMCETKLGYVEESNFGPDIDKNKIIKRYFRLLPPNEAEKVYESFKGTRLKNSGMICGPKKLVQETADAINKALLSSEVDFFWIDQLYMNYIVNKLDEDQRIALPEKFNYVLLSNKGHFVIEDDKVYDQTGELINVVHNAGGIFLRVIKKERPKDFDFIQYRQVIQVKGD